MTPDKQISLWGISGGKDVLSGLFIQSGSEDWNFRPGTTMSTTASGSSIPMYDGSTKQIQDVEVGDVVKSYQPFGMPDESWGGAFQSFTTTDLSGSTTQGSIVTEINSREFYGYYLINGSIKVPFSNQTVQEGNKYFVKSGDTWSWQKPSQIEVGEYFLNSSGTEVEITSKTLVSQEETFYGLNVEDIDTYFQSNILVHNIPPKCFVAGTPITMGDGTTKSIELVEVGDEIHNYDFDSKEIKVGKVLSIETPTHADIVEISFGDKKTKNTFDHPYWVVGKGWSSYKPQWTEKRYDIKTKQLEVGDKCLELHDRKLVEIEITDLQEDINPVQTYSLEVETHHNYFANDVLVHNKFCFMPDQVINMGEGNYKRIDEIELGESVLVFDEENDEFKEGKVNSIMKKLHEDCYEMHLESGQTLKPTGNHPFLIKGRGWSTIDGHNPNHAGGDGKVDVGDYVRDLDGWVMIDSIKKIEGEHITYNLLNQDYGTIVAHDIVSHNSGPGDSCFVIGTLITMSDGTYKKIEDIVIGDEVKSFDIENGKFINSIVEKMHSPIHDNIVEYVFENGEKLKGTDDHPIWIKEKGWCSSNTKKTLSDYNIEVNEIELGDEFLNDEFSYNKLVEIRYTNEKLQTYNIEKLSNSKTYFAGKVLAHNESDT